MGAVKSVLPADTGKEDLLSLFPVFSLLLGAFSLATYPYIPELSVPFYMFFLSVVVLGDRIIKRSGSSRVSSRGWLGFASFSITVLLSRAFINTAGIATPKSTGSLGPFLVEQVWFHGLHLHHYIIGFFLAGAAGYLAIRGRLSERKTWILAGTGLGLVADEFGILVAGQTYHSLMSYPVIMALQLLLFILLVRDAGRLPGAD
ncbi:MAG: hypothetical protein ABEJ75_02320 [Candidatus Nanohaloarchaea archaeon]